MLVAHPRSGGEADAHFEEGFAHAVSVDWIVAVDGLLVHWLPQWARLDAGGVEGHAESLNVVVGLTISSCGLSRVCNTGSAANSAGDYLFVCFLLAFDAELGVERGRAEPEI